MACSCLFIADGIWPLGGIHVHLAHLGVVKPIDHQIVDREMPVAIAVRDPEQFSLADVALLALDVAIGRLWAASGYVAGKQTIACVDLIVGRARDDKERDALTYIGRPSSRVVDGESELWCAKDCPRRCRTLYW